MFSFCLIFVSATSMCIYVDIQMEQFEKYHMRIYLVSLHSPQNIEFEMLVSVFDNCLVILHNNVFRLERVSTPVLATRS